MADDPTELVTIQYPPTLATMETTRGSLDSFVPRGWVVLDRNGRVNTAATTAAKKEHN